MTKENREKQYLHFRDLEKTYEVSNPELDMGLTSVSSMRGRAKKNADTMLLRYLELAELEKPKVETKQVETKQVETKQVETKPKEKKDGKKPARSGN